MNLATAFSNGFLATQVEPCAAIVILGPKILTQLHSEWLEVSCLLAFNRHQAKMYVKHYYQGFLYTIIQYGMILHVYNTKSLKFAKPV